MRDSSGSNFIIMLLVAVPPICSTYILRHACSFVPLTTWPCSWLIFSKPLDLLNILWFLHVDVTFYIISLIQGSTWLIDPYWTLAPPMVAVFWLTSPGSIPLNARQITSTALLLIWSARLTHSYFRREKWAVGHQEDWRYAEMQIQYGKWWPVVQVRTLFHLMTSHLMLAASEICRASLAAACRTCANQRIAAERMTSLF
jgi:steroid 5-alpha reductase family enzyme